MKILIWIFVFALNLFTDVSAQKVARATRHFNEGRFDKSAELFKELAEKDGNDVAALYGYCFSMLKLYNESNTVIPKEDLIVFAELINKADKSYQTLNQNDKQFISTYLLSASNSNHYLKLIAEKMWINYIKDDVSPAKLEMYLQQYYKPFPLVAQSELNSLLDRRYYDSLAKQNTKEGWLFYTKKFQAGKYISIAQEAIALIDFDAAIKEPGISSLKAFIINHPREIYAKQAAIEIEKREYLELEKNPIQINLEVYLKKYPNTSYKVIIQEKLAAYYLDAVRFTKDFTLLGKTQEKLNSFQRTNIIKKYLDSCQELSFKLEADTLSDNTSLDDRLALIKKYSFLKNDQLKKLRDDFFGLWEKRLLTQIEDLKVEDIQFILSEYSDYPEASFSILLQNIQEHLILSLQSWKEKTIKVALQNQYRDINEERLQKMTLIVSPIIKISLEINTQQILQKIKKYSKIKDPLNRLLLEFKSQITTNDIFVETQENESGYLFGMTYPSETDKNNYRFFVWNGLDYVSPEINSSAPIYKTIASRYGTSSFSKPMFTGYVQDGKEYWVRVFGYKKQDLISQPSLIITMAYLIQGNKAIADRAINIENNYGSVDLSNKTNNYINITNQLKQILAN